MVEHLTLTRFNSIVVRLKVNAEIALEDAHHD